MPRMYQRDRLADLRRRIEALSVTVAALQRQPERRRIPSPIVRFGGNDVKLDLPSVFDVCSQEEVVAFYALPPLFDAYEEENESSHESAIDFDCPPLFDGRESGHGETSFHVSPESPSSFHLASIFDVYPNEDVYVSLKGIPDFTKEVPPLFDSYEDIEDLTTEDSRDSKATFGSPMGFDSPPLFDVYNEEGEDVGYDLLLFSGLQAEDDVLVVLPTTCGELGGETENTHKVFDQIPDSLFVGFPNFLLVDEKLRLTQPKYKRLNPAHIQVIGAECVAEYRYQQVVFDPGEFKVTYSWKLACDLPMPAEMVIGDHHLNKEEIGTIAEINYTSYGVVRGARNGVFTGSNVINLKEDEPALASDVVGMFLYLKGVQYIMWCTYDEHFYASFAPLERFPRIELNIQCYSENALKFFGVIHIYWLRPAHASEISQITILMLYCHRSSRQFHIAGLCTITGNVDIESQDERESDGSELSSPASHGHGSHHHSFKDDSTRYEKKNSPACISIMADSKYIEQVGPENDNAFQMGRELKSEGFDSNNLKVELIQFEKDSLSANDIGSGTSNSENESQVCQTKQEETHDVADDLVAAASVDVLVTPEVATSVEAIEVIESSWAENTAASNAFQSASSCDDGKLLPATDDALVSLMESAQQEFKEYILRG